MPMYIIKYEITEHRFGSLDVEAETLEDAIEQVEDETDTLTLLEHAGDDETTVVVRNDECGEVVVLVDLVKGDE